MHADFDGVVALIVAVVATIFSCISLYATYRIATKTEEAQENSENRRYFSTLWDKITDLNHTNPATPNEDTVRRTLNTLDLIALCWQAGVLDKEMARIGFGKLYCEFYDEIHSVNTPVPILNKSGRALLSEAPEIEVVYNEIKSKLLEVGKIKR